MIDVLQADWQSSQFFLLNESRREFQIWLVMIKSRYGFYHGNIWILSWFIMILKLHHDLLSWISDLLSWIAVVWIDWMCCEHQSIGFLKHFPHASIHIYLFKYNFISRSSKNCCGLPRDSCADIRECCISVLMFSVL